ncbi:hypothetical protein D043_0365A, partial [Vibrio parahaemolyticus EKP-021]
MQRCCGGKVNR